VPIIHVDNRNDIHVGLGQKAVEKLTAAAARPDESEPDLVAGADDLADGRRTQQRGRTGRNPHSFHKSAPRQVFTRHGVRLSRLFGPCRHP
jgi:hypothetical protein